MRAYQLPDWIATQATKNKRRAFRFIMRSVTAVAITAWLGAAADTRGTGYHPLLHLACGGVRHGLTMMAACGCRNIEFVCGRVRRDRCARPASD